MNNIFDFNRFVRLINRQWISLGKIYLMSLGIIAGIFIAFYSYYINRAIASQDFQDIANILDFRPILFMVLGLAFISIVSGTYFSNLGDKSKAVFELLIPASTLEKFLVSLFYSVLLTTISYFIVFYLIDLAFVTYIRSNFTSVSTYFSSELNKEVQYYNLMYYFQSDIPEQLYWMLFVPFLLSAIFLLGSIAFKNFQFIKTAILIVIYCFLFILTTIKLMTWVTADSILVEDGLIFSDEMNVLKLICAIGVILSIIFWIIGYLRLKEKEV